ncbi:hypothetical protein J2741_002089 [Methanolinea mesophila]|nr:hypothetical protein [Methanolinea mesophila]
MRDLVRVLEPERVLVAGVMARTAAEESGVVAEFPGLPPSIVLSRAGPGAVLVNRGKTPDSGRIFGELVASRLPGRGLVQVECSDATVYVWDGGDQAHAGRIASLLGFRQVAARVREHTGGEVRKIRGCLPGEAVYLNGIVIGTATGGDVLLECRNGLIVPRAGIRTKPHGLEKALRTGPVDLSCAWCKSGPVRMTTPGSIGKGRPTGRVILVDHCAHEVYGHLFPETCGMVTVGDDTTAVCAHIGAHLGIPVLGIVDGDADSIVPAAFAPGSVVVHTTRERDDDLGREVAGWIDSRDVEWTVFRDDVLTRLEGRVRVIWP